MRKVLVALALALGLAAPALAATCTCSSACNLTTSTNWACPVSPAVPGATDDVICAAGCNLTIPAGTYTNNYFWVKPLGTATVTGTVVWNFDGPTLLLYGHDTFFSVGAANDDRGTFLSSNKDLTIKWIGAGTAFMVLGPPGNGGNTDDTTLNYTSVTMRGVERVPGGGAVAAIFQTDSTPPDTAMTYCIDSTVAPTSGAVGDTITFTGGKSDEFWYEVACYPEQCTGAGTANAGFPAGCCTLADTTAVCANNACAGGPCDIQINMASTGATPGSVAASRSWHSMTMVAGVGGPFRGPTPVDSDANGSPNGNGLLPAIGDTFAVFKPVLITGGTDPILNGIWVHTGTGGIDWKYVEIAKIGGGVGEDCDPDLGDGDTGLFDTGAKFLNPEGGIEFINVHDWASRQAAWEMSYTDDPRDIKPNQGRTYRHLYIHDTDDRVAAVCPGQGVTSAGRALNFGIDTDDRVFDQILIDGLHIARWGADYATTLTGTYTLGANWKRVELRNVLFHDYPEDPAYSTAGSGFDVLGGSQTVVNGLSMWDCGATGRPCTALSASQGGQDDNGYVITARFSNAFITNIDSNGTGESGGGGEPGRAVDFGGPGTLSRTSRGLTLSNSYLYRLVGSVVGGRILFNFIKDTNLEDDGAAPCTVVSGRAALQSPVDAIGNVITRSHALSCMEDAIMVGSQHASGYTDRTRRIISNLMFGMDTDGAMAINGLYVRNNSPAPTRAIDFYNNIVDLRGAAGNGVSCGIYDGANTAPITAFYNVFMNATEGNSYSICFAGGTWDEGYNRHYRIFNTPAVDGGNAASDVDSDLQDIFIDPWSNGYTQKCESPDKTRGPYGNPVGALRFGINSFSHFHPAVIPLMDADAFKLRYNWLSCGAAYQDAIPR